MSDSDKVITVMVALFGACVIYAIVLDRTHDLYAPKWTILTVVVGDGLIFLALWAIELWGVPLMAWGMVFVAMLVAGIPIAVGQFVQHARNQGKRVGRSERKGG